MPVIRFEHLSEAQKRAYLIADNQLALQAGWSEELLAAELAWLSDESFDLDVVGFDATELERLLAIADGEAELDEAEDEVPEPPEEPVSKPGDLWVLGNHRLLCGDATVLTDLERVLGGQLADMTWTDPPYNVELGIPSHTSTPVIALEMESPGDQVAEVRRRHPAGASRLLPPRSHGPLQSPALPCPIASTSRPLPWGRHRTIRSLPPATQSQP